MKTNERIRELRNKTGLSQSKFATHFGMPVRTLQQWEQGKCSPPEYVVRMMDYILHLEKERDEKNGDGKTSVI